jgi:hypothetical protein
MAQLQRPPGLQLSNYESDVPSTDESNVHICGILHAVNPSDIDNLKRFWIEDITLYTQAVAILQQSHFQQFGYMPYSSPDRWNAALPTEPLDPTVINAAAFTARVPPPPPKKPAAPGLMSPPPMQRNVQPQVTPGTNARNIFGRPSLPPPQPGAPPGTGAGGAPQAPVDPPGAQGNAAGIGPGGFFFGTQTAPPAAPPPQYQQRATNLGRNPAPAL